jgi:hypothetical protein
MTQMALPKKYELPKFLVGTLSQKAYERWLRRKAQAHVRRDRRRGNELALGEEYRDLIHSAVIQSEGRDAYTGEALDWTLISKYDNEESKSGGRSYKHVFALLPTVDHAAPGKKPEAFRICAWRTNDAKHDLDMPEFLALCRAVLGHNGFIVERGG